MEQNKKSKLLLAAVIVGVLGVVLWGIMFVPLMARVDGTGNASFFSEFPGIVIVGLGTLLLAIMLNVLGRLKYDTEKIFGAGMLYLFSLSIPSAILCFIGFAKFKKQGIGQNKRSELLLAAVTLGLCGLILWGVLLFIPLMTSTDGTRNDSFFLTMVKLIGESNPFERGIPGGGDSFSNNIKPLASLALLLWALFLAPLSVLAAFVLNVLGWLKNDAKKTFIAGIVYIVSLSIPSAVLCFIGRAKLKKQKT